MTVNLHTLITATADAIAAHADGTVDWIEHLGDQNHLHVTVKGHKLITLAETDTPLQKGDGVSIHLRAPLFFDGNGNRIGR